MTRHLKLACALLIAAALPASAALYAWVGNGSTDDWDDSDNWSLTSGSGGAYPDDTGDDALVNGTYDVGLIDETIRDLTLKGTVMLSDPDSVDPTLVTRKLTITGVSGGTTVIIKQQSRLETTGC